MLNRLTGARLNKLCYGMEAVPFLSFFPFFLSFQVAGAKVEEKSTISKVKPTGVSLALMSGVLTTDAVLLSAPTIAKRIFAPHFGSLLSRYHPELKLPKLFRKRNQAEQRQNSIPGKAHLLQSERFDDPGKEKNA